MAEPPALSDDEMRETLDLIATAIASMSSRINDLTRVADKQIKVSTEAWIAAFAARDQTNPDHYAEYAVMLIDDPLSARMDQIKELVGNKRQIVSSTAYRGLVWVLSFWLWR